jgi:hypothetical protein
VPRAMADNSTPHAARDYEADVRRTIPLHAELLRQAIDVAFAAVPNPARWLDTGCGPGRLVEIARAFDAPPPRCSPSHAS